MSKQPMVVRDVAHLAELASGEAAADFFIAFGRGSIFNSSKRIHYHPPAPGSRYHLGRFWILNEIDDSEQTLWPSHLWTRSNIGEALDKGALFARPD